MELLNQAEIEAKFTKDPAFGVFCHFCSKPDKYLQILFCKKCNLNCCLDCEGKINEGKLLEVFPVTPEFLEKLKEHELYLNWFLLEMHWLKIYNLIIIDKILAGRSPKFIVACLKFLPGLAVKSLFYRKFPADSFSSVKLSPPLVSFVCFFPLPCLPIFLNSICSEVWLSLHQGSPP